MAILAQESEIENFFASRTKTSNEHISLHVHFSFSTNICLKTTIMKHRICFLTEATDFSGN